MEEFPWLNLPQWKQFELSLNSRDHEKEWLTNTYEVLQIF